MEDGHQADIPKLTPAVSSHSGLIGDFILLPTMCQKMYWSVPIILNQIRKIPIIRIIGIQTVHYAMYHVLKTIPS